jgi:hypothetical protein
VTSVFEAVAFAIVVVFSYIGLTIWLGLCAYFVYALLSLLIRGHL